MSIGVPSSTEKPSFLKRCLYFIDASHLFIGLAGFILTAETFVVNHVPVDYPLCFLIGSATVVFYGLHRLVQIKKYKGIPSRRFDMLDRYRHVVISFLILALISCLVLVWYYFMQYWQVWLALAVFSSLYLLPLFKRQRRIRDFPFIKIFAIALAWPIVTVGLPYFMSDVLNVSLVFLFIEHFLFFILITLPFDIRDRVEDGRLGLRTLATKLTRVQFNRLGYALFLLHTMIIWAFPLELTYTVSLQVFGLLGLISLLVSRENSPLWYFSFIIDGLIIGRLIVYVVASIIIGYL